MTDLRTRIAAVLDRHYFAHPESQPPTQVSLAGADAVTDNGNRTDLRDFIDELGLADAVAALDDEDDC